MSTVLGWLNAELINWITLAKFKIPIKSMQGVLLFLTIYIQVYTVCAWVFWKNQSSYMQKVLFHTLFPDWLPAVRISFLAFQFLFCFFTFYSVLFCYSILSVDYCWVCSLYVPICFFCYNKFTIVSNPPQTYTTQTACTLRLMY